MSANSRSADSRSANSRSARKIAALFVAVFLVLGSASASAQAFFTAKTKGTFQVRFTSATAGVQVSIDGEPAGIIPFSVWVKPGVHQFSFTAPGEETKTIAYPVKNDVDVPYLASKKSYPLTVNTNVPGALIAIDGQAIAGNSASIAAGKHTLTISAPGYQTLVLPIDQPASANTINVALVSSLFPLTINTNVPTAVLAIDGTVIAGNTTSITAGAHTLSVTAPGYQAVNLPFQQPSAANTLNITLIGLPATLVVNTDKVLKPGTAFKVFIDNAEAKGSVLSLTPGTHLVRIVSGSLSLETTVALAAGQSLTLTPSVLWEMR